MVLFIVVSVASDGRGEDCCGRDGGAPIPTRACHAAVESVAPAWQSHVAAAETAALPSRNGFRGDRLVEYCLGRRVMKKLPISVSMISGAEAGRIGRALESVREW